jgi:hypothetical protein
MCFLAIWIFGSVVYFFCVRYEVAVDFHCILRDVYSLGETIRATNCLTCVKPWLQLPALKREKRGEENRVKGGGREGRRERLGLELSIFFS